VGGEVQQHAAAGGDQARRPVLPVRLLRWLFHGALPVPTTHDLPVAKTAVWEHPVLQREMTMMKKLRLNWFGGKRDYQLCKHHSLMEQLKIIGGAEDDEFVRWRGSGILVL